MSDTTTPPPGFSLVQPQDIGTGNTDAASNNVVPPPGFSLVPPVANQEQQSPSVARDVGHGVGMGLIKGASMVLGFPTDVWSMLDRGYQYGLTKGAEKMGLITPEQGAELRQPAPGEEYQYTSEKINKRLLALAEKMGSDTSAPRTVPGQYAETVASFLPGAVSFGASSAAEVPGALTRYGVVPGVASETAGQLTKGTQAEPYARMAGAIIPELALQGFQAAGRAMSPVPRMVDGMTDTEAQVAQSLLDDSRAIGAPITTAEAVQFATGGGTRAGDIQRVVEQSPQGAAIMRPFMAERPAQTEAMARGAFDEISPAVTAPFEVPAKIQGAAENIVSAAGKARTAAVNPAYAAAATDTVPLTDMESFLGRIDGMINRDKTGLLAPQLEKLRNALTEVPASPGQARVPITDIENLDRARKYFRDVVDLPSVSANALPNEVGGKIGDLLGDLRTMMVNASPDFAAGKQNYQQITENTINPLVRSPVGQLAGAETFPKQAGILFNTKPYPGSQRAIGDAVRQVAAAEPDSARQMVRMYLERTFDEATQANIPGANQWGGPKFAAIVSGNSQQAKNLEASIRALPNGDVRWAAMRKGLDIMAAMGARQPVGSQTAFNAQIAKWMEQGNPAVEFVATAASPGSWLSVMDKLKDRVMFDRNTERLAKIFTEGDIADLRQIAHSGRTSFAGQAAMIGLLAKEGALSPGEGASQ